MKIPSAHHRLIATTTLLSFLIITSYGSLIPPIHAADSLYYIHTDHLGSTTVVTDDNGDVVSQSRNYPYGSDRVTPNGSRVTERSYTSQIKDSETSLYYYNARYYDPALGTFIAADILGGRINRYAYVGNNPVMATDPTGHMFDPGGGGGGSAQLPWEPLVSVPGISSSYGQTSTPTSAYAYEGFHAPEYAWGGPRIPDINLWRDLVANPASEVTFDTVLRDLDEIEGMLTGMLVMGYVGQMLQMAGNSIGTWRAGRVAPRIDLRAASDADMQAYFGENSGMHPNASISGRYGSMTNPIDAWMTAEGINQRAAQGAQGPLTVVDAAGSRGNALQSFAGEFSDIPMNVYNADMNYGTLRGPGGGSGLREINLNAFRLPFRSGSVDILFEANVYDYYPGAAWAMQEEAMRVLRPGGILIGGTDPYSVGAEGLWMLVK